jgi:uroporphyrinogen III methyltransferase / synthase
MSGALAGITVWNPRAPHQAPALSERIRRLGGRAVEAPVLDIAPGDRDALIAALRDLAAGRFAAFCLTSPNGADAVADALAASDLDARVFAGAPLIACIGPGTAAAMWEGLRIRPDLEPEHATTTALAAAFPPGAGEVLLARADIATPQLADGLTAKGYDPVEVVAYRTVSPGRLDPTVGGALAAGEVDLVAVASSSTARGVHTLAGDLLDGVGIVSIGPVTSRTCAELGLPVAVEATRHDLDGLVDALVAAAAGRR